MIESIQASSSHLPAGSFDFTPEGYAKASYWVPADGYSWKDFTKRYGPGFSSVEEIKAKQAEFTAGKMEVVDDHYWKRSLRTLLPDRWILAYTRDKAWRTINDRKEPLYSQMKRTLYIKSIILGYGEGPIHQKLPSKNLARYIKEHCASSARLKAIALRAYESVANMAGYHAWTTESPPIFLCLAAAKSSLDAMSAVLWALVLRDTPTGNKTPSMASLYAKLNAEKKFNSEFARLYESAWFKKLELARNKVIHRSANPIVHDDFGAAFDYDLGLFRQIAPNRINVGRPRAKLERNMERIHLDKIVKGFVLGLEKWEQSVARKLAKAAWFPSFNTDGILLGIEFANQNLLRDGSGPSHMVCSHHEGTRYKYTFFGLHPFNKRSKNAPSDSPESRKLQ